VIGFALRACDSYDDPTHLAATLRMTNSLCQEQLTDVDNIDKRF
jgi:hypothetical protein